MQKMRLARLVVLLSYFLGSWIQAGDAAKITATPENNVEISTTHKKLKNFPCSECHEQFTIEDISFPMDDPHEDKQLRHMKDANNCGICHSIDTPDKLIMQNEEKIAFAESHRICGQCHGEKHRDWTRGIHGKQIGHWNGKKIRFSCTECHNPHVPKFPLMIPSPPPVKPRFSVSKQPHEK